MAAVCDHATNSLSALNKLSLDPQLNEPFSWIPIGQRRVSCANLRCSSRWRLILRPILSFASRTPTFCVYNPLRYVGEFLLKELHSALFEISRGQFSSIEQDLSLDPPAPLYPAPKKQPPENDAAHTTAVSVEITNVAAQPATTDVEQPDTEATTAEPTTEATSSAPSHAETATETTTVESAEPEIAKPSAPQEQTATPVTLELPEEEQPEEPIEGLPAESELAAGGSSDSYTWAPPEPTAYVPLSDRPLKAIKYEAGSAKPANPPQKPAPAEPTADPWFEKHAPKQ